MKHPIAVFCAATTLCLVCIIVLRTVTKKQPSGDRPPERLYTIATQIADAFAEVRTRPLSMEQFSYAIRSSAGTDLATLSDNERQKLYACIDRFYACYSSGSFGAFKLLRHHPPQILSNGLVAAVRKMASEKHTQLESDEDILRFAWETYNGTNRIGEVSAESIRLAVVKRQDLGTDLRKPSVSKWPELATPMCWEGAVVYQPGPAELLQNEGVLRFFTLEVVVRFSPQSAGPATPLVLIGYWDSSRGDWMPLALCRMFQAGAYDTIF